MARAKKAPSFDFVSAKADISLALQTYSRFVPNMSSYQFFLSGERLIALPSGALWLPDIGAVVASDLHLGKANRIARREGRLTPPYETMETLTRLSDVLAEYRPKTVICLGDSFDDGYAESQLTYDERAAISALMAGRRWIWIAGNHDPAPTEFGGAHLGEHKIGPLIFRHIAETDAVGEVSGHYHPKVRMRGRRPCFLADSRRVIMPAFGVYTGGLKVSDPVFDDLLGSDALALMTGRSVMPAPRKAFLDANRTV